MPTKICTQCQKDKPLSEYFKNKNTRDGYHASCKECQLVKKQTKSNIHKITERELQYIVDNWANKDSDFISHYLKITRTTLSSYVGILRKLGVVIPHKSKLGNRQVFLDFAEQWKENNKVKKV